MPTRIAAIVFLTALAVPLSAAEPVKIGMGVGEMYPDFLLPRVDGDGKPGTLRLSDYRGKKVFLFHFASW